jgi:hypothetical protein
MRGHDAAFAFEFARLVNPCRLSISNRFLRNSGVVRFDRARIPVWILPRP